jgi:hypothetical protein
MSVATVKEHIRRENKRTSDRNRRFKKMTKAQQRVAIARDVLKLLTENKIAAIRGEYFELSDNGYDLNAAVADIELEFVPPNVTNCFQHADITLKELIHVPSVTCNVCAIGAVFTAAVARRGINGDETVCTVSKNVGGGGELTTTETIERRTMVRVMRPYFTPRQLSVLEDFFEGSDYDIDDSDDALRMAMKHIIKTKGKEVAPPRSEWASE